MFPFLSKKSLFSFSFLKFSQTLAQIENVSSINQKVELLSQYIMTLSDQEKLQTKKIFDLVNQKIKTGISDKLLINNSDKIFGAKLAPTIVKVDNDSSDSTQKNKETIAILEQFISNDKVSLNLQVQEIHNAVQTISKIEGKGAVETKINEVTNILSNLSFVQSRFFLRILTKDLKIGMKNRLVEKAYNDAQPIKSGSNLALNFKSFSAMLARPLRDVEEFLKFCGKKKGVIIADVKYDGQRTLITFEKGKKIVLISRNGKQQNEKYYKIAENLQKLLQNQPGLQSITLDAQILAIDKLTKEPLPFQVLLTKRRKVDSVLPADETQDTEEVVYVFDILEHNGQKLYETPLAERKKLIFENELIKKGEYQTFKYPEESNKLMQYFHVIIKRKYEGLILKGPQDHYYTNGTRIHWGKLKKGFRQKKEDKGLIDLDLILMGADYGRGKKAHLFSSFLMGVKKGNTVVPVSRVGTGFTDDDLEHLTHEFSAKIQKTIDSRYVIPKNIRMDVWFKPELVIEVDCQEFTRSPLYELGFKNNYGGISLRFPVFKRLRDDKSINEATESDQIIEEMQKQEKKCQQRSERKLANMKSGLGEERKIKIELSEEKKVLL